MARPLALLGLGVLLGLALGLPSWLGAGRGGLEEEDAALRDEVHRLAAQVDALATRATPAAGKSMDADRVGQAAEGKSPDGATASTPAGVAAGAEARPAVPVEGPVYLGRTAGQWAALLANPDSRDDAAEQLRAADPASAEVLVDLLLRGHESGLYSLVRTTLEKMGAPALPPLRRALAKGNDDQRMAAASLLGRIRPVEPETVEALGKALRDMSNDVRMNVGATLRALGPQAAGAVPALIEAIERTTDYVRVRYVEAVAAIGPAAAAAEPVLRRLLEESDDQFLRVISATALFRVGVPAAQVLPIVMDGARSDVSGLRAYAFSAIRQFGDQAGPAVGLLAEVLTGDDTHAKMCAASALGAIGPAAAEAMPALQAACHDADVRVQNAAAAALKKVRGP